MKKIFFLIFIILSQSGTGQVTILEDSLFSQNLNVTMKFTALLPNGYAESHERYPVLYLLHGFGGNHSNWVRLTEIVRYARPYSMIIIMPDAKNSWYSDSPVLPNAKYEEYIIKEVIPFVDKKFRTLQSKFHRSIAGLSMGGYGAAKFGIKYPSLFSFAGCLSPALQVPASMEDSMLSSRRSKESNQSTREMFGFPRNEGWDDNDVYMLLEKSNVRTLPYFYLSVGSSDGIPEIIDHTHSFAAALRKKAASFEMHEVPGAHDWKLWDKEIVFVLERISELSRKKR